MTQEEWYIPEDQAHDPNGGSWIIGDSWPELWPDGSVHIITVTDYDDATGTFQLNGETVGYQEPPAAQQRPQPQAQPSYGVRPSGGQTLGGAQLPGMSVDPSVYFQQKAVDQQLAAAEAQRLQSAQAQKAAETALSYPLQLGQLTGFIPNPMRMDYSRIGQFLLGQQQNPFAAGRSSGFVRYNPSQTYQAPTTGGATATSMSYADALASARQQLVGLDASWAQRPDQDVVNEWLTNPTIGVGQDALKAALRGGG